MRFHIPLPVLFLWLCFESSFDFSFIFDVDCLYLTRFNKIAIPNNKFQMSSGQGSHWLIERQFYHLFVARPYQIYVNYIFKHIHTTSINTTIWQFVSFTLCEKENFLMSNLKCSLTNAAWCPLVLLPSLSFKNTFLSISS